jgi:signal transduction histidine kinase
LQEIHTRSRELVTAMDEIVWAVNPRNDSVPSVAAYFSQFAQRLVKPAGLRCRLDIGGHLPALPMKAEQRHNLFLAFKEALTNVLKHANATELRLAIQVRDQTFTVSLEDNGVGFTPNLTGAGATGADGLPNMRNRLSQLGGACEINSQCGKGTQVLFRLPLAPPGAP